MTYKEAIKKSFAIGGYVTHHLLACIYATSLGKQMALDDTRIQYRIARKLCGMETDREQEVLQSRKNLAEEIKEAHMFSTILKDDWYPCDENGDIVFLETLGNKSN